MVSMRPLPRQISPRMSDPRRQILLDIRRGLLGLHKALIVAEQVTYERINGRVDSTGKLLQLVLNDPWFTWLHPLSQMVVRIDELLEDEDEVTDVEVEHFLTEVRALIRPSSPGPSRSSRSTATAPGPASASTSPG